MSARNGWIYECDSVYEVIELLLERIDRLELMVEAMVAEEVGD